MTRIHVIATRTPATILLDQTNHVADELVTLGKFAVEEGDVRVAIEFDPPLRLEAHDARPE